MYIKIFVFTSVFYAKNITVMWLCMLCEGASIIEIMSAISLFPVTVGVRRGQENQNPPTDVVTQASNSTINEEVDERTPLLV